MAYSSIVKPTDYFNTVLYTGNGSTQSITGVGFQPDWVWLKLRSTTGNHGLYDAVRGATKRLQSNQTNAEDTITSFSSFDSDGFTLSEASQNNNGETFASWNWKANGQGSSNTDGSINTTYTSVNTTAGFSISTYTGTGSAATVGHGLGVAPKMIITKNISTTTNWHVYHEAIGATKYLHLNLTNAEGTASSVWNNTAPTSSVFSIGTGDGTNKSGDTIVAYCFAEKTGYSKFGFYTGNGSTDGAFAYTGFKPAFLLWKNSSAAEGWWIVDNKRTIINPTNNLLRADQNAAELVGNANLKLDLLSNGFKLRQTDGALNSSGAKFIYMAIGQTMVGSNNVPATAR